MTMIERNDSLPSFCCSERQCRADPVGFMIRATSAFMDSSETRVGGESKPRKMASDGAGPGPLWAVAETAASVTKRTERSIDVSRTAYTSAPVDKTSLWECGM